VHLKFPELITFFIPLSADAVQKTVFEPLLRGEHAIAVPRPRNAAAATRPYGNLRSKPSAATLAFLDGGIHMRSNSVSIRIPSFEPIKYSSRRQLPTLSYRQLNQTDGRDTRLALTEDIEAHCSTRFPAQNFPGFWLRAQPNLRNSNFCKPTLVVSAGPKNKAIGGPCTTPNRLLVST